MHHLALEKSRKKGQLWLVLCAFLCNGTDFCTTTRYIQMRVMILRLMVIFTMFETLRPQRDLYLPFLHHVKNDINGDNSTNNCPIMTKLGQEVYFWGTNHTKYTLKGLAKWAGRNRQTA